MPSPKKETSNDLFREDLERHARHVEGLLSLHSQYVADVSSRAVDEHARNVLKNQREAMQSLGRRLEECLKEQQVLAEHRMTAAIVKALEEQMSLPSILSAPPRLPAFQPAAPEPPAASSVNGIKSPRASDGRPTFSRPSVMEDFDEADADKRASFESRNSFYSMPSKNNKESRASTTSEDEEEPVRIKPTLKTAVTLKLQKTFMPNSLVDEASQHSRTKKNRSHNGKELSFKDMQEAFGVKRKTVAEFRPEEVETSDHWAFRKFCIRTVHHRRFEPFCSCVMMLCAVQIALEADFNIKNLDVVPPPYYRAMDLVFNTAFTCELIVRFTADGLHFLSCFNPAIRWNMMDTFLVSSAILDELIALAASALGGIDLSSLRLLRMMRLVRVARILRVVRFFSELRVMVNGIMGSAKSLLWASVLLSLVMLLVGVTIMQFVAMYLSSHEEDVIIETREYYGGITTTFKTLFMAISGGIDWRDAERPLGVINPILTVLFAAYIFFTMFCCLNIVTGIFVDNAKALKAADEEAMFQEAVAERKRWIAEVAELFAKVGENDEEGFTFHQFKIKMHTDIRVQALFRKLGIDTDSTSPEELWEILDTDDSGSIDQEEFAKGIKYFKGSAKSIDVYRLRRDGGKLEKKVDALSKTCKSTLTEMQRVQSSQAEALNAIAWLAAKEQAGNGQGLRAASNGDDGHYQPDVEGFSPSKDSLS